MGIALLIMNTLGYESATVMGKGNNRTRKDKTKQKNENDQGMSMPSSTYIICLQSLDTMIPLHFFLIKIYLCKCMLKYLKHNNYLLILGKLVLVQRKVAA